MTTEYKFDVSYKNNETLSISLSTTMENIDKVDEETRKFLKKFGLDSELFSVSLVMREALTNAVRHGHHYDFNKIIFYAIEFKEDTIIMTVEDQGEGFDWRAAGKEEPDPSSDHGRGIIIMKQYFTDYCYNEKGNKIVLIKKIEEI